MLFSMYPIIFQMKRGWNSGVGELPLLGTVVGAFIGAMIVLWDSRRQQKVIDSGRALEPEDRLALGHVRWCPLRRLQFLAGVEWRVHVG